MRINSRSNIKQIEMNYKIEKNIPIPDPNPASAKYPWATMEVGDSFFVEEYSSKIQISMATAANQWVKKYNPKASFVTRKCDEGLRVWRTK